MSYKILQATEYFLPDVERGIERFVYELSKGLIERGNRVTVLTGGNDDNKTIDGMRVIYAPMYGSGIMQASRNLYDQRLTFVPSGVLKMNTDDSDIIHAHHFAGGYAATLLRGSKKRPLVMTVHVVPRSSILASPVPVYRMMYRKALQRSSCVVSVTEYVKYAVKKDFGIDSVVVPLCVDIERFKPAKDKERLKAELGLPPAPIILMVSSLNDRRKRAGMIISAMPSVLKKISDARLVLAGNLSGDMKEDLEKLVSGLGLKENVIFTGRLEDDALPKYYAAADVFVLPSREEAAGFVLLEAMASGVPLVGANSGGIPEYVRDGINGLLFDPRKVDDLAEKVISILASDSDSRTYGRKGRHLAVTEHSWPVAVKRYDEIYGNVVMN
ncbi:hypothetical protein CUJ83_01750 [Methanocella sp. CWC-04]|uniref:Uncharacterized protein n=1 Tax=Methanooceanicella nereidis TaxID=2052831 RepID=A0AAP2RA38_9EURY|nr:glycosyltransferase family 4 protein [Methanocella sp. CWC-04]MCD1293719.1 hypothetical protein [Methanocella sp. CWC-04]